MQPRPFGDSFADALRHYLKTNNLKQSQLTHAIVSDLAQRHFDHHEAQKKTRKAKGDASPQEIAIYEAYPKKVGRLDALKSIREALGKVAQERLLERVGRYAQCVSRWPVNYRFKEGRDTVPNPSTWFNQGRWTDDEKEWLPAGMFQREDDPMGGQPERAALLLEPQEGWRERIQRAADRYKEQNDGAECDLHYYAKATWDSLPHRIKLKCHQEAPAPCPNVFEELKRQIAQ